MTEQELLKRLEALKVRLPALEDINVKSPELHEMLAEAEVLIDIWDKTKMDIICMRSSISCLHLSEESNYLQIFKIISKAIYELKIKYPEENNRQIYAAGETYAFYSDFKKIVSNATASVFFIDPYANQEVFDLYIKQLPPHVGCRILLNNPDKNLKILIEKLKLSPTNKVEVCQSNKMHDRVVFIDKERCWVIAQRSPHFLKPLFL